MPLRFAILPAPSAPGPGATATATANGEGGAEGPARALAFEIVDDLDEVQVGRRQGVEIELPFAGVSTLHARLFRGQLPGDWWVEDLGSTNGSWLDGLRLDAGQPRPLRSGQRLRFATVDIAFEGWSRAPRGGESTATLARRLIGDLLVRGGDAVPTLTVEAGAIAGPLPLAERDRRYLVGRGEACDLPLPVEHVSREHAVFVRGWSGVTVEDRTSKNGVDVNGRRASGRQPLADGDRIAIGPVVLRLSDPEDRYLGGIARLDDGSTVAGRGRAAAPTPPVLAAAPAARRGRLAHHLAVGVAAARVAAAVAGLFALGLGSL
jgi:pSer/pThr/pTyr-binding forkhead associated (FHA) protein